MKENERICNNLVSHIRSGSFLLTYFAECLSVFIINFEQANTVWEG